VRAGRVDEEAAVRDGQPARLIARVGAAEATVEAAEEVAESAVAELGLEGVIQVASFHPRYQFAGTAPDDLSNATNRSPYPTLHLLREESVERAVAAFPEAEAIFEANIATMRRLGESGWARLQQQCRDDAVGSAPA